MALTSVDLYPIGSCTDLTSDNLPTLGLSVGRVGALNTVYTFVVGMQLTFRTFEARRDMRELYRGVVENHYYHRFLMGRLPVSQ